MRNNDKAMPVIFKKFLKGSRARFTVIQLLLSTLAARYYFFID